jgi:hypothetical protein
MPKTAINVDIIKTAKRIECKSCRKGVVMCKMRPCWGTVEDFKKIIEVGHAKKLMIDYYNDKAINNNERIHFLSGASNGNECSKATWNPKGICIFLENDKCIINDIKPTVGAVMCCKHKQDSKLMHACLMTWTTKKGRDLIESWKKMVDYKDKDDNEDFDITEAFSLMMFGF